MTLSRFSKKNNIFLIFPMFIRRTKTFFQSIVRYHHVYLDQHNLSATGISLNEFQQRRQSLVDRIRKSHLVGEKDFLICLPASTRLFMGPDVMYFPFKQQADFYYFTGCLQPDAMLILNRHQQQFTTHLFLPKLPDEHYERWHGEVITDKDQICQLFGIDQVSSTEDLSTLKVSPSSIVLYDSQTIDSTNVKQENFHMFRKKIVFITSISAVERLPSCLTGDQISRRTKSNPSSMSNRFPRIYSNDEKLS